MPRIHYADDLTLHVARARYFESAGLDDGGYADRWVVLRVAGIPIGAVPNTAQRVRSVRLHDVHHVLTGYDTSWTGEAEIAGWELASGCANHAAAWFFNIFAALIGLLIAPRALWAAAVRGRGQQNLYAGEWDEALLNRRLGELRRHLAID